MSGFDEVILACRPVRIEDYPPDQRRIHAKVVAQLGAEPTIYPGSTFMECVDCGIEVAVGPRQQEALTRQHVVVCCLIDAARRAAQYEHELMSLDNPFRRKP